jgi:hypothetical protein
MVLSVAEALCSQQLAGIIRYAGSTSFGLLKIANIKTAKSTTADAYLMADGSIQPGRVTISNLTPAAI